MASNRYSNRIQINEFDYSTGSSEAEGGQIGFTLVKSENGPDTPVLIEGGDVNTFKDIFGDPETCAKDNAPSIYEAQRFVSSYSCYMSAPYSGSAVKVRGLELKKDNNTYTLTETTDDIDYDEDGNYSLGTGVIALFVPKYPTNRALHIHLEGTKVSSEKTRLLVTAWMDGAYHNANHKYNKIEVDLVEGATNEAGAYVGLSSNNGDYADNNIFICVPSDTLTAVDLHSISSLEASTSAPTVGKIPDAENWNRVIEKMSSSELQSIDVVFSTSTYSTSVSDFFSLGDNVDLSTSAFLFNYTVSPSDASADLSSLGNRYWNIYNEGVITLRNGRKFYTNFIGDRAVMQCRINSVKLGGWAPMWLNTGTSTSGIGGQLGVKVEKMRYSLRDSSIQSLCEKNFNPIIKDPTYGTMLISQATCKGGAKTDWSYIGHVASFLQFEKEMLPIMKEQIGKPNNPYYRTLRASQVQRLLDKRTEGEDRIWAEAVVNTSTDDGVNDAEARSNREFVISVMVKVEVFSEWVILNFTNVDQATVIG